VFVAFFGLLLEILCIDLHQTGYVLCEGSDYLQLIKFWPSCAPGMGSATGRKCLALPYYIQRAVSLHLSERFFIQLGNLMFDKLSFHFQQARQRVLSST